MSNEPVSASGDFSTAPPAAPPSGESATLSSVASLSNGAASPSDERIPGYEILGELGRGAMGVVYKARQTTLDRLVALKMILTGSYASEAERARFRTEAEAIARLQHPNIVQVHEVGEWAGCPFFSLEFCAGGNLGQKLNGTPLPSQDAARLVEALARAVHAAHEKNVIHRDLKPANVLLSADGTPKVTDFGLARKLDDVGQTAAGAILGTPSYMAPEQAVGKGHAAVPAADVYALGAILYECLTGRPPFRAATTAETLLQVVADEPVPPTQLQPRTPRDLETICLKCLQKDPARRYASASALGDDLGRFLRREPIHARPVGRLERLAKWVRRNPTVASLSAAVVLVLVAGTVISTCFWFAATARATEAKQREQEANKARASAEDAVARGLLRPLGDAPHGALNELELEALWELASSSSERVRQRFLEQALDRASTARQLKNRLHSAVVAAIGVDPERREQALELLRRRLRELSLDGRIREVCVYLVVELETEDPQLLRSASQMLRDLLVEVERDDREVALQDLLFLLSARMEPEQAARACSATADLLLAAMDKTKHEGALRELAAGVSVVGARLEPSRAADLLLAAMSKTTSPVTLSELATSLSAVAAGLEPSKTARFLLDGMGKTTVPSRLSALAISLSAVVARMEPSKAATTATAAADLLLAAMTKTTDVVNLRNLADGLSAVTARMEPSKAAATAAAAADLLLTPLGQIIQSGPEFRQVYHGLETVYSEEQYHLAAALSAVAAWLEPGKAAATRAAAVDLLLAAMCKERRGDELHLHAESLSAIITREEPGKARVIAAVATEFLLTAMDKTKDEGALRELAAGLAALAAHLEPSKAADLLLAAMRKTTQADIRHRLAAGLAAVAANLEPGRAAATAEAAAELLLVAMGKTTTAGDLHQLAERPSAVTIHLEPGQAVSLLLKATDMARDSDTLRSLAKGLSLATERVGPASIQRLVDCLKHPCCTGRARTQILFALGQHFPDRPGVRDAERRLASSSHLAGPLGDWVAQQQARAFTDLWDAVAYLRKHHPEIDLTSPPRRPQR
jgi:hypothetical protein